MGACCKVCSSNKNNHINDKTESNQIKRYINQANTSLPNQLSPQDDDDFYKQLQFCRSLYYNSSSINNNNISQNYKKYEEILNRDFKYFNIFWFDPKITKEYNNFIKCFENVEFYKAHSFDAAKNFFEQQSISEWIVITPGSSALNLISNLENFKCIKSFFIFCSNAEFYKTWARMLKIVGCITSSPEELCYKLIEINKKYIIPNFNYKTQENISCYSNEINKELKYDSQTSGFKSFFSLAKMKQKDQLSKFYIKSLYYINSDEIQKDSQETNNERHSIFSFGLNFFKSNQILFPKFLDYIKDLTILSLYFHNYPYLLNLLSFQEVKEAFENPVSHSLAQKDVIILSKELSGIIMNNESILVDKEKLKKFQLALIYLASLSNRIENRDITQFIYYYQIVNFFRDIDFCLKQYLVTMYPMINNKEYNSINEFIFCSTSEPRYMIYSQYQIQFNNPSTFEDNEQSIINNTLTIKDFIVLGDNNFYKKIKMIENKIIADSFQYLNIE